MCCIDSSDGRGDDGWAQPSERRNSRAAALVNSGARYSGGVGMGWKFRGKYDCVERGPLYYKKPEVKPVVSLPPYRKLKS